MDQLTGISTFVKVLELASFSAAAKQLCVSAAVVSNRIQLLEKRLNARLLNRTTRRVRPTEAGKAYYERCVFLLSEIEEAEHVVQSLHSSPRGTLRLSVSHSIEHLISALTCKFSRTHPALSFETVASEELRDLVGEGFDLAVRVGGAYACPSGVSSDPARPSMQYCRQVGARLQRSDASLIFLPSNSGRQTHKTPIFRMSLKVRLLQHVSLCRQCTLQQNHVRKCHEMFES